MKWHRGDLEGQPRGDERHADEQQWLLPQVTIGDRRCDRHELRGAGDTVGEADPVEEQRGCERAQEKLFDGGFVRGGPVARDPYEHIRAQRHQLQTKIEDHELGR